MKLVVCERCGGMAFYEQNGYRICQYCNSAYLIQAEDIPDKGSNIAIDDDVQMLLQKCITDPMNARRYASLILDIDPGNIEARRYL